MNYFLKMRFTQWTIIILLIILIAILGTFLYLKLNNNGMLRPNPSRHERFGEMLKRELKLTPEQGRKFREFRIEFENIAKPVFDSITKKRIEMVNELSKTNPDTIILYRISNDIGKLHAQLKRETVNNILKMKSICTPEQLLKFNMLNKRLIGPEGPMHRRENNQRNGPKQCRN